MPRLRKEWIDLVLETLRARDKPIDVRGLYRSLKPSLPRYVGKHQVIAILRVLHAQGKVEKLFGGYFRREGTNEVIEWKAA